MTPVFLFAGPESVNMESRAKPVLQPSSEKIQFVDRLAISTKRKRSTPQKFLGEFFLFKYTHILAVIICEVIP